jgi:adenylate kinase
VKAVNHLNIQFPVEKLPSKCFSGRNVTVMIGVSGCGKTRTCTDIGKRYPCLYFEVSKHSDFLKMLDGLEVLPTDKNLEIETQKL